MQKEVDSYSFGSTNLSDYLAKLRDSNQAILNLNYFTFVPYETATELTNQPVSMSFERNSDYESQTESMDFDPLNQANLDRPNLPSTMSGASGSHTKLCNLAKHESMTGEELDEHASTSRVDLLGSDSQMMHQQISKKGKYRKTKVAQSHHFRTVRTLSKCKECDVMNFNFQGLECVQVSDTLHVLLIAFSMINIVVFNFSLLLLSFF